MLKTNRPASLGLAGWFFRFRKKVDPSSCPVFGESKGWFEQDLTKLVHEWINKIVGEVLPDQCWKSVRRQRFRTGHMQKLSEHILAIERESIKWGGRIRKQFWVVLFDGLHFLWWVKRQSMIVKELNAPSLLFRTKEPNLPVPIEGPAIECKISTFTKDLLKLVAFVLSALFSNHFVQSMESGQVGPTVKEITNGAASNDHGLFASLPHPGGQGWDVRNHGKS